MLFYCHLPLEKGRALNLNKLENTLPKDALCQVWLKLTQWFWRTSFFYFVDVFSLLSPLGKGRGHASEQTYPRMLCAKFGWNWSSGSGEEDFLISSIYFCYFVIFYPWKRAGPFIWTNLYALHPNMLCAKFGWNWPGGSGEEDENVKTRTDDGQQPIKKAHLSFQLRWAKNILCLRWYDFYQIGIFLFHEKIKT